MQKINGSKKWICAAAIAMFLVMLVCNYFTDMCTDDFHYLYSFADHQRIDSVTDIFPSMAAHARTMNGRLIAHFFVQLFLMLPGFVFDLVNSAMFVLQAWLIYRIANRRQESNVLLFALCFCGVWLFELAFGQVNLWLTGSCNYLWCAVFALAVILPFADKLSYDRDIRSPIAQIAYLVLCFVAGSYSENVAPTVMFTCFFMACYAMFVLKYKLKLYHFAALALCFAGFVWMMSAPFNRYAGSEFSLKAIFTSFGRAGNMFYKMWPLVLGLAVLMTIAFMRGLDKKILAAAVILTAAAVFAECLMIFADYNVERRAFFTTVLMVAAAGLLMAELIRTKEYRISLSCVAVCLLLASGYFISLGAADILLTHADVKKNEAYIISCRNNGVMDVTVPNVETRTHYSALNGLQYLRMDTTYWLNTSMADYYGVNTVRKEAE